MRQRQQFRIVLACSTDMQRFGNESDTTCRLAAQQVANA